MYFIYTCLINLHIRGNRDYIKTEMERTVSRAFDSWERPETLCNKTTNWDRKTLVFKSHILYMFSIYYPLGIVTLHFSIHPSHLVVNGYYVKASLSISKSKFFSHKAVIVLDYPNPPIIMYFEHFSVLQLLWVTVFCYYLFPTTTPKL